MYKIKDLVMNMHYLEKIQRKTKGKNHTHTQTHIHTHAEKRKRNQKLDIESGINYKLVQTMKVKIK